MHTRRAPVVPVDSCRRTSAYVDVALSVARVHSEEGDESAPANITVILGAGTKNPFRSKLQTDGVAALLAAKLSRNTDLKLLPGLA